jgi:hypothetical protein
METRERAIARIAQTRAIKEVRELEPRALMQIMKEALGTQPEENHWMAYERIKKLAKTVVGHGAARPELRSTEHYDTLLSLVEWMLPTYQEEIEILDEDEPLYDYDEDEPAYVLPRKVERMASGFKSLGEIVESILAEEPRRIE